MRDGGEDAQEERMRSHSARAELLDLLAEADRELSVEEIRTELPGKPGLRDLYYHLRVLEANYLVAKDGDRYKLR